MTSSLIRIVNNGILVEGDCEIDYSIGALGLKVLHLFEFDHAWVLSCRYKSNGQGL